MSPVTATSGGSYKMCDVGAGLLSIGATAEVRVCLYVAFSNNG